MVALVVADDVVADVVANVVVGCFRWDMYRFMSLYHAWWTSLYALGSILGALASTLFHFLSSFFNDVNLAISQRKRPTTATIDKNDVVTTMAPKKRKKRCQNHAKRSENDANRLKTVRKRPKKRFV